MFTVKFAKSHTSNGSHSGGNTVVSIACPHYEVLRRENGVNTVTVFTKTLDTQGVDRTVMSEKVALELARNEQEMPQLARNEQGVLQPKTQPTSYVNNEQVHSPATTQR